MATDFNFTKTPFRGNAFILVLPSDLKDILDYFSWKGDQLDVYFTQSLTTQQEIDLQTAVDAVDADLIQWEVVRAEQSSLINDYIWMAERHERQVIRNVTPLSNTVTEYEAILDYMQDVRDVDTQEDPFDITWPTKPI